MLNSYKELNVWQVSVDLVSELYLVTEKLPKSEIYGLTNQIRRAAVSIPANIAEGYARKHRQEYIQFLRIAYGSGAELETHIIIAKKLGFISSEDCVQVDSLLDQTMKMLNKLVASLLNKNPNG